MHAPLLTQRTFAGQKQPRTPPPSPEAKPELVPELIEAIALHLPRDVHTLHSCVLVSRTWCATVVPLLWADPFTLLARAQRRFGALFAMYLALLDLDDRRALTNAGVRLPRRVLWPRFDYLSFLRVY